MSCIYAALTRKTTLLTVFFYFSSFQEFITLTLETLLTILAIVDTERFQKSSELIFFFFLISANLESLL